MKPSEVMEGNESLLGNERHNEKDERTCTALKNPRLLNGNHKKRIRVNVLVFIIISAY